MWEMMSIRWKSKRQGFLLYEAVIGLMVTILTLSILQQSLQILKVVQNTSYRDQIRWHITQEKLQSHFNNGQVTNVTENQIYFIDNVDKKLKIIEKYRGNQGLMLRMRFAGKSGQEPIMTNLKKIKIEKSQNLVMITTVSKKEHTSEMYLTTNAK